MNSVAEWTASIPDMVSAREALVFIDVALRDADEATREILGRFAGGTLPPPPWPQHPELRTAIEALEGGRTLLQQYVAHGNGDTKAPRNGPIGARLLAGGQRLYAEIARMQNNMKPITKEQLAAKAAAAAANLAAKAAATPIGGLAVLLGAVYLIDRFGGE